MAPAELERCRDVRGSRGRGRIPSAGLGGAAAADPVPLGPRGHTAGPAGPFQNRPDPKPRAVREDAPRRRLRSEVRGGSRGHGEGSGCAGPSVPPSRPGSFSLFFTPRCSRGGFVLSLGWGVEFSPHPFSVKIRAIGKKPHGSCLFRGRKKRKVGEEELPIHRE